MFVLMMRVSMVMALAALDRPVSLKIAWHMTGRVGWRRPGAIALVTLTSLFLAQVIIIPGFLLKTGAPTTGGGLLVEIASYFFIEVGNSLAVMLTFLTTTTVFGIA